MPSIQSIEMGGQLLSLLAARHVKRYAAQNSAAERQQGPYVVTMPALTEVVFLSQEQAESYVPRPCEAIISITDHGASSADLNAGWHAVLRISFDDVDPVDSPAEPGEDVIELQDDQADRIAAFVRDNFHSVNTLVVHCKYGQSRSAGVAKAIAKEHGLAFPEGYTYANNHVYELVLHSLRLQGGA